MYRLDMSSASHFHKPFAKVTSRWTFFFLGVVAIVQLAATSVALGPQLRQTAERLRQALAPEPLPPQSLATIQVPLPQVPVVQEDELPKSAPIDSSLPVADALTNAQTPVSTQDFILRSSLEAVVIARSARKRGDMQLALDKLREAQTLAPDNPEVLAELATTFESMGLLDKAITQWRAVYQIGPRGGIYFRIAGDKITKGVGQTSNPTEITNTPQERAEPESDDLLMARETSKVIIETATTEKTDNPNATTDVKLKLVFKAKDPPLIAKDAKVQVFFYDIIDNQDVVLTNADTIYDWATKPVDWVNGSTEELNVDYRQTDSQSNPEEKQGSRKYLGYIVRLYYNKNLQDVSAEPRRLLDLFPPPPILTDELLESDNPSR
jgi:tetratricopeptide (TPR) repeat protein